jgi:hypothetical protein
MKAVVATRAVAVSRVVACVERMAILLSTPEQVRM